MRRKLKYLSFSILFFFILFSFIFFSPERVIAFGNGNNDRGMLKTAKMGGVVILEERCSGDAINL